MPLAVWNNLGRTSRLGSSRGFDAKPIDAPRRAPNLFVDLPEGDPTHLPPGTRLLFHGVLTDPTSGATVNLSLTNAVEVLFE